MVKVEKANIAETYSNGALYGAPLGRLKTLASNIGLDQKKLIGQMHYFICIEFLQRRY